jgi:hypothetical protein
MLRYILSPFYYYFALLCADFVSGIVPGYLQQVVFSVVRLSALPSISFFFLCFSFFPLFLPFFIAFFTFCFRILRTFFHGFFSSFLTVCDGFSEILYLFFADFLRNLCPLVTDFLTFYICSLRIFAEFFARL